MLREQVRSPQSRTVRPPGSARRHVAAPRGDGGHRSSGKGKSSIPDASTGRRSLGNGSLIRNATWSTNARPRAWSKADRPEESVNVTAGASTVIERGLVSSASRMRATNRSTVEWSSSPSTVMMASTPSCLASTRSSAACEDSQSSRRTNLPPYPAGKLRTSAVAPPIDALCPLGHRVGGGSASLEVRCGPGDAAALAAYSRPGGSVGAPARPPVPAGRTPPPLGPRVEGT